MKTAITAQEAKGLLTPTGWIMVSRRLLRWPSRSGKYTIVRSGYLYFKET